MLIFYAINFLLLTIVAETYVDRVVSRDKFFCITTCREAYVARLVFTR
jgi:hypothetical protein